MGKRCWGSLHSPHRWLDDGQAIPVIVLDRYFYSSNGHRNDQGIINALKAFKRLVEDEAIRMIVLDYAEEAETARALIEFLELQDSVSLVNIDWSHSNGWLPYTSHARAVVYWAEWMTVFWDLDSGYYVKRYGQKGFVPETELLEGMRGLLRGIETVMEQGKRRDFRFKTE